MTVTTTPILRGSCTGPSAASILLDAKIAYNCQTNTNKRRRRWSSTSTIPGQDADAIEYMLSQLTPDELEIAARTDYQYLKKVASSAGDGAGARVEEESEVEGGARLMALRYLKSKKGDRKLAIQKMKATLAFRKDIDIDGLRLAFEDPFSESSRPLEKFLASGKNYVQSYDKCGRATHVFVPRNTQEHDAEWTLKESLYTMERAIACSKAPDASVNCLLDFQGFNAVTHSPPITLGKDFLLTLRSHYAGQVHKIFILDAPAAFAWVWKIFQPFLGKATQEKIVFVSGRKQKEKVLSQYYDCDQATKWMCPQSGKMIDRPLDTQEYCWKTPFDTAFSEE